MALADLARNYYAAQAALADTVTKFATNLWGRLDRDRPAASWSSQRVGSRLFVAVSTAQASTSEGAEQFVARAVREQNAVSDPVASLEPRSLAGVASDGRDLDTLLAQPLIQVESALSRGVKPEEAHASGGMTLAMILRTQVADTHRAATATAMAAEPAVTGWVRMLVPPSCGRCAILAGRRYRVSEAFLRHPL